MIDVLANLRNSRAWKSSCPERSRKSSPTILVQLQLLFSLLSFLLSPWHTFCPWDPCYSPSLLLPPHFSVCLHEHHSLFPTELLGLCCCLHPPCQPPLCLLLLSHGHCCSKAHQLELPSAPSAQNLPNRYFPNLPMQSLTVDMTQDWNQHHCQEGFSQVLFSIFTVSGRSHSLLHCPS